MRGPGWPPRRGSGLPFPGPGNPRPAGGTRAVIVAFGSINVDLVVRVPALPRAGETVLAPDYKAFPGGKGANQAAAAARAGAVTRMVGSVGNDGFGDQALEALADAGVDVARVARGDLATGCAFIAVDRQGRNQIAVAAGANRLARADQVEDGLLGPDITVLLQLEVEPEESCKLARRAHDKGARVILNAAPAGPIPDRAFADLDVVVVNEVEARAVAEASGLSGGDPQEAARALAEAHRVATVVTLGGEGAVAFDGGQAWKIGALAIDPVDTTAAGDAFVGALAAALDAGLGLAEALQPANAAGGLACLSLGAQASLPDKAAIEAALSELPPARRLGRKMR